MEALHNLGIDGKLLVAQAVNFLILLFVLQRFAYKPMAAFLAKRTATIEKGLADARAAEERIKAIAVQEQETLAAAQVQARELIAQAEAHAKERGDAVIAAMEQRADALLAEARDAAAAERDRMMRETREEIVDLVGDAVAKVLKDASTPHAEAATVRRFLQDDAPNA